VGQNLRRPRVRLIAALAPVSGMAVGATMAFGAAPATQPGVILPLAADDGQAATQAVDTSSTTAPPTTQPALSTTTTPTTTAAPTTTDAAPPAETQPSGTSVPETTAPAPAMTTPPATSIVEQPGMTTIAPSEPGPTDVSQPPSTIVVTTPPDHQGGAVAAPSTRVPKAAPAPAKPAKPGDDGDVLSDPPPSALHPKTPSVVLPPSAGIPESADPGPGLAVPPIGPAVPASDRAAVSAVAVAASAAAQRLAELTSARQHLASIAGQVAALDEEIATSHAGQNPVVAAALPAMRAELEARRLEAQVVTNAAALGHDVARHDLAVAVSTNAGGVDPEALDAIWQRTDPRRLGVMYTALRQVGAPYVFDTAGPTEFDCSGLTLYAWQTVGVHLAHYSFTQRSQIPEASPTQLRPGDLIFNLRSTGGHVMLSLGYEHLMVHAPAPGLHVTVARWRKATGFGAPLGGDVAALTVAPPSPSEPTVPPLQAAPAHPTTPTPKTMPTPAPASSVLTTPSEIADEAGARYGMDPALLVARAALAHDAAGVGGRRVAAPALRPDLVAALGVDPTDPRSVTDATARYLVAATTELGDVATALAALDIGAGAASASRWPGAVERDVDQVLARADELNHPAAPAPPKGLEHALVWLSSGWAIRHHLP
jgi:cell wall-associated NlpC family hydrolase